MEENRERAGTVDGDDVVLLHTTIVESLEAVIVNGIKGRGKEMKFSKLLSLPQSSSSFSLTLSPNFLPHLFLVRRGSCCWSSCIHQFSSAIIVGHVGKRIVPI